MVPTTRRERIRGQTLQEIREAARRQFETTGGTLSLKALAQELGMAPPSLYRYVESRDELLTQLLVEAYAELATALESSVADPGRPPEDRLRSYARAYRAWALARPALYELLFGTPVPGYVAPEEATGALARRSMALLVVLLGELRGGHDIAALRSRAVAVEEGDPDDAALLIAVRIWARMHGLLSLELRGHLPHLVGDPERLYEAEIDAALALAAGDR